jgi:hypothetical protein
MLKKSCRLLVVLLLFSAESAAVHLPRCEKDLPIVPAAIRDRQQEAELQAAEPEQPTAQDWQAVPAGKRSSAHLALKTGRPAEEVLRFYQQMFGVALREEPAPPLARLIFHDKESIWDCYDQRGQRMLDGQKARAAMETNRKPLLPGRWLKGATFSWMVHEANGDLSELTLEIEDASFDCGFRSSQTDTTETRIHFSRMTWQAPDTLGIETR